MAKAKKGQHGHHNEQRRVQAALEIELNQDIVTDQGGANQQGDEPDGSGLLEILPKGGKKYSRCRLPYPETDLA